MRQLSTKKRSRGCLIQRHWAFLAVLLVGTAIFLSPLASEGWFSSHDTPAHIHRIFATIYEMQQGHYFPRWLSLAAYGKGLPDLIFYSPAFYWLTGWINLLGIPLEWDLKIVCLTFSFIGGIGVYIWVGRYTDRIGSLISTTLYLFLPYRFLDLYVRGAIPEFAALSLLPWLFFSIDLSFSTKQRSQGLALAALSSASIVLFHHLSAIMVLPFATIYFLWHAATFRHEPKRILTATVGPLVGAGLSAFYWLPVLMEMKYLLFFGDHVKIKNPLQVWDHFITPFQWFDTGWGVGLSVIGPNDGMSFQIGVVLGLIVILTTVSLIFMLRSVRNSGHHVM
ncbi:MAG: 6-pyruvoyl-tetrahydropterin synthase-related protein [Desulfuromonadales bacterium]|nr:6-pyruvoyl-tetrahydropterin synthase-related protein [Desulfuromonadales bacterium]